MGKEMRLVNNKKKALQLKAKRREEIDYQANLIDAKNMNKGLWKRIK